jgi:DNA repair protein RAD5
MSSDNDANATSTNGAVDIDAMIKQFKEEETNGTLVKGNVFAEGVLANLSENSDNECPICLDVSETPVVIPGCMHQWYVYSKS